MDDWLFALTGYVERYPEERRVVSRFFALLESWPECLFRTFLPGHLTGSAWVTNPDGTSVLLTHHRKLDRWLQLGGHADGDGDLVGVARREAHEESGVQNLDLVSVNNLQIFDLDVHPIPQSEAPGDHEHFDVRFAFATSREIEPVVSDESHDVHWVPLGEIESYTDELSILRMKEKWAGHTRSRGIGSGP